MERRLGMLAGVAAALVLLLTLLLVTHSEVDCHLARPDNRARSQSGHLVKLPGYEPPPSFH